MHLKIISIICALMLIEVPLITSEPKKVNLNLLSKQVSNDQMSNSSNSTDKKYEPSWPSLDTRPLPTWYDDAKIGIFLHWGVYAVPSFGSEWFWMNWKGTNSSTYVDFMKKNYPPDFSYQEFGRDFRAESFDPQHWANLFQASGARYVVLTSKHHDGFALWPSKYSFSWNSMDVGPHRDLIGELSQAIRNQTDLRFGLYHSLYEWFNPMYLSDKAENWRTQTFVNNKMLPQLYELVNEYRPSIIWSDGDWEAPDTYFTSCKFLAWLYNESPVKDEVLVNDRWGQGIPCKHGDFYTCQDRYDPGVLQPHKWENAMTLDKKSWGYRRDAKLEDYMTTKELLIQLVRTISCGGNILINVGPSAQGTIDVIFEERLRALGSWLDTNGPAVYQTEVWLHQNDTLTTGVWFTRPKADKNVVYAFFYDWPETDVLEIEVLAKHMDTSGAVRMLGFKRNLEWMKGKTVKILLPSKAMIHVENCWVLEITLSDI